MVANMSADVPHRCPFNISTLAKYLVNKRIIPPLHHLSVPVDVGMRIEKPEEVREAVEEAIRTPSTVVMDFRVEKEENVWPMVPAGAAISEMIDGVELL